MLFKKFAVAAAIATTLAFVGCSKKEEAPAAAATEAVEAATDATAAAPEAADAAVDATVAADAAASEATDAAVAADAAASEAAPVEASAAQ